MTVVVSDVGFKDGLEVAAPEDEGAIEALSTERADEPLGECVCKRSLDRCAQDPQTLGAEHLIEAGHVLTVPIADEEAEGKAVPLGNEVAGLLGDPGGVGTGGNAPKMDPAGSDLDEEQHIETMQEHGVDG
jgi:hypothetical protein